MFQPNLGGEIAITDGISLQHSTSLAPQSGILIVGSEQATQEFDVESFIDIVRNTPCIWNQWRSARVFTEYPGVPRIIFFSVVFDMSFSIPSFKIRCHLLLFYIRIFYQTMIQKRRRR